MESTRKEAYKRVRATVVTVDFRSVLCASGDPDGGINSMLIESEIDGNTNFI